MHRELKLRVRVYNVGLGDCIYLCIPDASRNVHILIDCGNRYGTLESLGNVIKDLEKELPYHEKDPKRKRLDLLVVTHPHEEHCKGFEEAFFRKIIIDRIWLSPAFDRQNPKAKAYFALDEAPNRALKGFGKLALGDMQVQALELELLSMTKGEVIDTLTNRLPGRYGIHPLFVSTDTPADQLRVFDDPSIKLKVLGPMGDIDNYYIGGEGLMGCSPQGLADGYRNLFPDYDASIHPANISIIDFKQIHNLVNPFTLTFSEMAGHITNNLSIVLLLEWHGRRLLFPGDAEWNGAANGEVRPGMSNGSWNVMWTERRADLSRPLDFLLLGHHGAAYATPWAPGHPISKILDALLPLPQGGSKSGLAQAVVTTLRTSRLNYLPDPFLMMEIGKRVANFRTSYVEKPGPNSVQPHVPQPQRTDQEVYKDTESQYIDTLFNPKG